MHSLCCLEEGPDASLSWLLWIVLGILSIIGSGWLAGQP